ncbi:TetR/AcrR family transcriptional regulator [Salininema proteolyticum]|uniref:TetR/AcrR family transcriptional regulator n=1 Tax=Salininema proteolyticum TaxID=1607685 RepID=A0ABV8TYN4_9ACTN
MTNSESRERLVRAAMKLVEEQGVKALSTRAVCEEAGVQAPALYRLFGDKEGLLDAVAEAGFERYLGAKKALEGSDDALADLRSGWDGHVRFGLENPDLYRLMFGRVTAEGMVRGPMGEAKAMLRSLVGRIAAQGELTVDVETAADLILSANIGVTLYLIDSPEEDRDLGLSDVSRDSVTGMISSREVRTKSPLAAQAAKLRSTLAATEDCGLTKGEKALMEELLERLAG